MFSKTLTKDQFLALYSAFDKARAELGISYAESDANRREQLAQLMISLARDGEGDADVIRAQAVHQMRPPAAGLFHE